METTKTSNMCKAIIMRADRVRFCGVVLLLIGIHTGATIVFLPLRDALVSLVGLLCLLVVSRAFFVRMVPSLPVAAAPCLIELMRTHWILRGVGALALCIAALFASLGYHGILFACSTTSGAGECADASALQQNKCAPQSATFASVWASVIGIGLGLDSALIIAESPTNLSAWPLAIQGPFARLRPTLPGTTVKAVRFCLQCTALLLFLAWVAPLLVHTCGAIVLGASGNCPACCRDAILGSCNNVRPTPSKMLGLLGRALALHLTCAVVLSSMRTAYTLPLDFRKASAQFTSVLNEAALEVAMAKEAHPLTQHLAFLDIATFAMHDQSRRQALFASEREGAWSRHLSSLLRPIDNVALALEAARKRRGSSSKLPSLGFLPRRFFSRLQIAHASLIEQASRMRILGASQLVVWAADATSSLIAASAKEDALGEVQLVSSLGSALTSLLRCMQALEAYVAGAPLGGARVRPPAYRSQQSVALRVALGPPAQVRAAGAQRASAIEAALSRAVYLLVHTYGTRAVLAAQIPSELRPRLEAFLGELF